MQHFYRKIGEKACALSRWRAEKFARSLLKLDNIYLQMHENGAASWQHSRAATRQFVRIFLLNSDFYFIVGGMAILVFVTRSFTEPGVDYGPWRPVVVSLAAILAGIIPIVLSVFLFPLHILFLVNTWVMTALNVGFSAVIFAWVEPVIPQFFYTQGVLQFADLFAGILVFYALALGYLQLRINRFVCFRSYKNRQKKQGIDTIIPVDKRGPVIAVSARDHYVEITTETGSHLERMTMRNALAMLEEKAGLQVHRSHWVAYSAMLSLEKSSGRCFLILRNGPQIPVSKTRVAEVETHLKDRYK